MKSWKTTFAGIAAGILMLFGSALNERATNPAAPPVTLGNLAPAAAVTVLGILAKDHGSDDNGNGPSGTGTGIG